MKTKDKLSKNGVNPLIICGQGTYFNGEYYSEYPDESLCLHQAIEVNTVIQKFNYDFLVRSGGFTQSKAPWLSEAQSFIDMWKEMNVKVKIPHITDDIALDSSENLLFGLIMARIALIDKGDGEIPFRRIGAFAVWSYKRHRFSKNAQSLGIGSRFYFHGFADAEAATFEILPHRRKKPTFEEFEADSNPQKYLLRNAQFEIKRRKRWQNNTGTDKNLSNLDKWERKTDDKNNDIIMKYDGQIISRYSERLSIVNQYFPDLFLALKKLEANQNEETLNFFRKQFLKDIVKI